MWKNPDHVNPEHHKLSGSHRVGCKCSVCFRNSRLVRINVEIRRLTALLKSGDQSVLSGLMALYQEKIDLLEADKSTGKYVKPTKVIRRKVR